MNNLPNIQIQDVKSVKKYESSKLFLISTTTNSLSNSIQKTNVTHLLHSAKSFIQNNVYDYFNKVVPKEKVEKFYKTIKDEKFLFFIKYGILRRYEGDCEIIYIEMPQIPKKLVVYRRPLYRMKQLHKLILNNKDLPQIPLFESENKLKYLSLESNLINKIDQLISLNNLLYLNLYKNKIKEIENLNNLKKLKILLLGRNNITKIKNLNNLLDLEIIDLHSNKIKNIEGLQNLTKLKVLNLSNNLLCSFYELIYNKNLEELNIKKNVISTVPSISNGAFEKLKKLNISKNLITKVEILEEFTKMKSLRELIIEYNPVLTNPYSTTIVNLLPVKGKLPNFLSKSSLIDKKIETLQTNQKIDKLGSFFFKKKRQKIKSAFGLNQLRKKSLNSLKNKNERIPKISSLLTSKQKDKTISPKIHKSNIKTLFNNKIRNDKEKNSFTFNTHNLQKVVGDNCSFKEIYYNNLKKSQNDIDNNDVTISVKKIIINKQWLIDFYNIIKEGYNGYNNKRYKLTHMNQGLIEIEGEKKNCLNIYGHCLEILMDEKLYEQINILKFNYYNYHLIMSKKNMVYLKSFKNINQLCFNYNNIYSIYQILKLELFDNLEILEINNNEVCCSGGFIKYFLFYRIESLKMFNNEKNNKEEINISKNIFNYFDNIILQKEEEKEKENQKKDLNEKEENYNDFVYDNNDYKIQMWNYAKKNLSSALFNIIDEWDIKDF